MKLNLKTILLLTVFFCVNTVLVVVIFYGFDWDNRQFNWDDMNTSWDYMFIIMLALLITIMLSPVKILKLQNIFRKPKKDDV